MQRSIALLQLARSTAAWQGEISTALANRLLSNSQATTSAAYTQVRNARTVSKSSTRFQSGFRQPDDDQRDQQDSQTRRDGQSSNPSPADADRIRQQDQASEASEPEVGYVQDGPYPYSASEELEVINLAGSTETAWEFLGINEDENITWFGLDFTRGKVPEVERNALLSDSTKEMMYQMHSHDKTK